MQIGCGDAVHLVVRRSVVVVADDGRVDGGQRVDLQSAHVEKGGDLHGLEDEGQIVSSGGGGAIETEFHLIEGAGIDGDPDGVASDGEEFPA
jgi:hypothetical protein